MRIKTAVLGYPRIGEERELKKATEAYWRGEISKEALLEAGRQIRKRNWLTQKEAGIDLILTTGGTGLGPRDVTVEAVKGLIERDIPGVSETMRAYGQKRTPYAMLSRGAAGFIGKTLVITLPGSARGAKECLTALFPSILHVFNMVAGGGH